MYLLKRGTKNTRLTQGDDTMVIVRDPFASLAQEFEKAFAQPIKATYPPYNVAKIGDDEFWLEFALAGFSKSEIKVVVKDNVLTISGERKDENPDGAVYVHKGIATRKFIRSFTLPDWFEVTHAGMEDGILYVNLHKNVPEEKKPKEIQVK